MIDDYTDVSRFQIRRACVYIIINLYLSMGQYAYP